VCPPYRIRWILALGFKSTCKAAGTLLTLGLGLDAAHVPITMSFGKQSLELFRVVTEEIDLVSESAVVKAA
jgi:hypothetical protein